MGKDDLELGDIEIIKQQTESLYNLLNQHEDQNPNGSSPLIYMAPDVLRDLNPSAFTPRVVSIGPLHRGNQNLKAFEAHKVSYMATLLSRLSEQSEEEILQSCVQKVYASLNKIKEYYDWTKTTYNEAEFVKMMVLDACFILQFITQISESNGRLYMGEKLLFPNVMRDLLLLENQIPFFILDQIFQCTILKLFDASLVQLLLPVLYSLNIFEANLITNNISINDTSHILSLLHQCYQPFPPIRHGVCTRIHSAVNLDRAGVNFEPYRNPTCMMAMKVKLALFTCFCGSWRKPTLRMPILIVGDFTESALRNLIAYEQSDPTCNHVTSYAYAMDMLVNTHEDVAKLVESGVLVNYMGSNEEVATMINNICKEVTSFEFIYEEQWRALNTYCNCYWPQQIAKFMRTYFSSPWNSIALLVGIILFALTVVQTYFTIKYA